VEERDREGERERDGGTDRRAERENERSKGRQREVQESGSGCSSAYLESSGMKARGGYGEEKM